MKSQSDREQPAHRWIETMKCPKAGEREPWPELGGDGVHGALFRLVAAPDMWCEPTPSCGHACSRRALNDRVGPCFVTDSNRNPTTSRRLQDALGAACATPASPQRIWNRKRCRLSDRRRA